MGIPNRDSPEGFPTRLPSHAHEEYPMGISTGNFHGDPSRAWQIKWKAPLPSLPPQEWFHQCVRQATRNVPASTWFGHYIQDTAQQWACGQMCLRGEDGLGGWMGLPRLRSRSRQSVRAKHTPARAHQRPRRLASTAPAQQITPKRPGQGRPSQGA